MTLAAAAFAPGVFRDGHRAVRLRRRLAAVLRGDENAASLKLLNYELGPLPQAEALYKSISPSFYIHRASERHSFSCTAKGSSFRRSAASRLFVDRLEMHYKPFKYKTYPNGGSSHSRCILRVGDMRGLLRSVKDNATAGTAHCEGLGGKTQGEASRALSTLGRARRPMRGRRRALRRQQREGSA